MYSQMIRALIRWIARRVGIFRRALFLWMVCSNLAGLAETPFVNWETAPVHPIELSSDNAMLAVANLPGARLELFDITGPQPHSLESIPVGLDPVTVRFRHASEI